MNICARSTAAAAIPAQVEDQAFWKAGGAYVVLDPAYPKERLSFLIEDAQPLVLLTENVPPARS